MNFDQNKKKAQRHVNPEHLAVVLLGALGIVFILTIVIAGLLPKHTTPSELTLAEAAEAESETESSSVNKNALSYEESSSVNQNSGAVTDDSRTMILSLINEDLKKQLPSVNIEEVTSDDITIRQNDGQTIVKGSYTSTDDGKANQQSFSYVLTLSGGTWNIVSRDINRSSSSHISQKTGTSADLTSLASYQVNITTGLTADVSVTEGELKVVAVDENGSETTVFDETGPYENSSFTAALPAGSYTITIYGNASGWNFTFNAE